MYVNYGRTEDFFQLEREMGINCMGKIVIARYGKIFRGNKVRKLTFIPGKVFFLALAAKKFINVHDGTLGLCFFTFIKYKLTLLAFAVKL